MEQRANSGQNLMRRAEPGAADKKEGQPQGLREEAHGEGQDKFEATVTLVRLKGKQSSGPGGGRSDRRRSGTLPWSLP